jgi:hypothetical protein
MAPIAPHIASWSERPGGWQSSTPAVGRTDATYPMVELFLNEQWVDITSYVYYRDMITVTRGRSDEAAQVDPSTCRFTVNNRDGRFSPRNPTGPYYGFLTRNTPVRVSVVRNGVRRYRFYGEISSWPAQWDISGRDVWVEVEAAGILRRLGQGNASLRSALYREMTNPGRTGIVAYWPCEDADGSTTLTSGVASHPAATITGTPTLASYTSWAGSDPLPVMGTGKFTMNVPVYSPVDEASIRCYVGIPATGVTTAQTLLDISMTGASPTVGRWVVLIDTSLNLALRAYDLTGAQILDTGFVSLGISTSERFSLVLELRTLVGLFAQYNLIVEHWTSITHIGSVILTNSNTASIAAAVVGRITRIVVGGDQGLGDVSFGHLVVANDTAAYTNTGAAVLGWRGEQPVNRFARLCREERINYQDYTHGTTGGTTTMGLQASDGLPALLQEAVDSDLGLLVESREQVGLGLRTRLSLLNQSMAITLDYANHELSDSLNPIDDDRYTRNSVEVTRKNGTSAKASLTTGAMSTNPPPNGIGLYDTSITVSLGLDSEVADQAGWRLHLGTIDEARYPEISLNLRHSTFTGSVDMMNAALMLDLGDRLVVSNPPAWMPPDQISQIVERITETLGVLEHDMVITCSPESAYHVLALDSASYSWLDTAGSELAADMTSAATTAYVSTTTGPLWTTSGSDVPFDVTASGESMTVTSITSSVLDTFTRVTANGWGTPDVGTAWSLTGGAAADYSTSGTVGAHLLPAVGTSHLSYLTQIADDWDLQCDIATDQLSTGDSQYGGLAARAADLNNMYLARVEFTTAQAITLSLRKRTGSGTDTQLATFTTEMTHAAGTYVRVRFKGVGSSLYGRIWLTTQVEPEIWQVTATDTTFTTRANLGTRSVIGAANTNVNPSVTYDNFTSLNPQTFTVTRSANGVVKSQVAGTSVSLTNPVVLAL